MEQACKKILFSSDRLVKDIQQEFASLYPFLKIEFMKGEGTFSVKQDRVTPETNFRQIAPVSKPVTINFEAQRTIAEIEKDFKDLLGVSVQVFRKSGKVWNVISLTDGWTLESQNAAGEFISSEMTMPPTFKT